MDKFYGIEVWHKTWHELSMIDKKMFDNVYSSMQKWSHAHAISNEMMTDNFIH